MNEAQPGKARAGDCQVRGAPSRSLLWLVAWAIVCAPGAAPGARAPVAPYEAGAVSSPGPGIDRIVFEQLARLNIEPAHLCSDGVFIRRAYLDVIGTLPTAREAWDFVMDRSSAKRAALIDRLLARPEFADYWAMKWCDVLRVKAEFPINLWPNAVQAYHRWIRSALVSNMPCDKFARELLTASGSNFRAPQVNFYRALQTREPWAFAQIVALTFMGERVERWPTERLRAMGAFFAKIGFKNTAEWKEEIVFFDPAKGNAPPAPARPAKPGAPARAPQVAPAFPDGTPATVGPEQDPREVFADWLLAPGNPVFARNMANRAWAWLFGRGIIHEPDDIRPDNPPSNPELLAWLQNELVTHAWDIKHLFRTILNSQVYQLSSIPGGPHPGAEANFAHYPARRLDAEVLADAICQITGTTEEYTSPIPEPFTFIPDGHRSIALADGSITSSFLELFGRPARDSGIESERINRPTAAQCLHLLNSTHVQDKLERSFGVQTGRGAGRGPGRKPGLASGSGSGQTPKLRALVEAARDPRQAVSWLYLAILSRLPTPEELAAIAAARNDRQSEPGVDAAVDLAWALLNTAEFLYRH